MRGRLDLWMLPLVIVLDDEAVDGGIQLFEGQHRRGRRVAAGQVSGQFGQQLRIDGAEEAFNFSASLGLATVE